MAPESVGGGERVYTAYVTVPSASHAERSQSHRRWRAVAGALVVAIAVVTLSAAAVRKGNGTAVFSEKDLGEAAKAEQMGELSALASEAKVNKRPAIVKGQKLAWLNAGAVPDDNVFDHPDAWKAPDDPARPEPPSSNDEYTTALHPAGGLKIIHNTDNGSPTGDSFGIDRTSDDLFHGSAPSPPPATLEHVFKIPQGDQFKIIAPTDTGVAKTPSFTAFTIDTSTDDFFTHHPNPAAQCFTKVNDKYLEDWFVSKQAYKLEDAMTLCSTTKDCGGITKQEGYFGGIGWTLRHGTVPKEVVDPSGSIDTGLDLSRTCGPDRDSACAASQSSTDGEGVAGKAVDGYNSGDYADGYCTLTNTEDNPYWVEDFGKARRITKVKVYGRSDDLTDCLEGFRIRASDKADVTAPSRLCAADQPAPTEDTGWITEVTCDPPVEGQYLWVEVPGKDKVISLCGVEVTGSELDDGPAESYKYICADKRLNSN